MLKDVTRLGIESRTFWILTRCFNQLSYMVRSHMFWAISPETYDPL